jgi:hypothetical protein
VKHLLENSEKMLTLACIIITDTVSSETVSLATKKNIKIVKFSDLEVG